MTSEVESASRGAGPGLEAAVVGEAMLVMVVKEGFGGVFVVGVDERDAFIGEPMVGKTAAAALDLGTIPGYGGWWGCLVEALR